MGVCFHIIILRSHTRSGEPTETCLGKLWNEDTAEEQRGPLGSQMELSPGLRLRSTVFPTRVRWGTSEAVTCVTAASVPGCPGV